MKTYTITFTEKEFEHLDYLINALYGNMRDYEVNQIIKEKINQVKKKQE